MGRRTPKPGVESEKYWGKEDSFRSGEREGETERSSHKNLIDIIHTLNTSAHRFHVA